jgi:Holliday junction resolvase RusA-like endonuclease
MSKTYVIPFLPPSVNSCYRSFRGRVCKSKSYSDYIHRFDEYLKDRDIQIIKGPVKVEISFYKKGARSYDLDNRLKSLLDSIKDKLIEDDDMVVEIICKKFNMCVADKTLLIITPIYEGELNELEPFEVIPHV